MGQTSRERLLGVLEHVLHPHELAIHGPSQHQGAAYFSLCTHYSRERLDMTYRSRTMLQKLQL